VNNSNKKSSSAFLRVLRVVRDEPFGGRCVPWQFLCLVAMLAVAAPAAAHAQHLAISPADPLPGAIVRITLSGAPNVTRIAGTMSGEPLHFVKSGAEWHAIGPVSADATGDVAARVVITRSSGTTDTLQAVATVPAPTLAPAAKLAVSTTFTKPMDAATTARIARENGEARAVGKAAHETPALWTEPFLEPRHSVITSEFGSGRTFNGKVSSRHLGVDFRGAVGDTIYAANRGVVVLVEPFFLAGNVVYVSHGAGLVTGYFHMSRQLVSVGDTVARGQPIGLVGATGRVTGPHLHWTARYGAVTVNPLDLIQLDRAWYSGMEPALQTGH
jgi:murein DD-endopeptidase MepM/ murein hydrolase activator NlpD